MKKVNLMIAICLAAVCVFFATGCQNDTIADDGIALRNYGDGGGSGGNSWDNAFVESGYEIFDYQSWGDYDAASEMSLSAAGMKITRTGAWAGGGIVCADNSLKFDFTGIVKITFDIRGIVGNGRLFVQQNTKDVEASIVQIGGDVLSATDYKSMEMNVSSISTAKDVTNCFTFVIGSDQDGGAKGNWFEVKNIKFVDNNGNSIKLTAK